MIIAEGKVIVGEKTYTAGEVVTGLSKADIERMTKEGFIKVVEPKESAKPKDSKKKKETESDL